MKFTEQQLLQAARAVGLGRESFSTAELREQLGVSTKDQKKLNQFYRSFRALQSAEGEIEKLGPNCYRLRAREEERTVEVDASELSEVGRVSALIQESAPAHDEVVGVAQELVASPECTAEPGAAVEPCVAEEIEVGAESVESPAAVVPSWRGHVQRLGSRMRSWFGGNAGAAAQA